MTSGCCVGRPAKKYPLITAGEIIAKEGNAYEAKKNDSEVCDKPHARARLLLRVLLPAYWQGNMRRGVASSAHAPSGRNR